MRRFFFAVSIHMTFGRPFICPCSTTTSLLLLWRSYGFHDGDFMQWNGKERQRWAERNVVYNKLETQKKVVGGRKNWNFYAKISPYKRKIFVQDELVGKFFWKAEENSSFDETFAQTITPMRPVCVLTSVKFMKNAWISFDYTRNFIKPKQMRRTRCELKNWVRNFRVFMSLQSLPPFNRRRVVVVVCG